MSGFGAGAFTALVLVVGAAMLIFAMYLIKAEKPGEMNAAPQVGLAAFVVIALGGYLLGFWIAKGTWL